MGPARVDRAGRGGSRGRVLTAVSLPSAVAASTAVVAAVDESASNPWSAAVLVLVVLGGLLLAWAAFLQVRARLRRTASQQVHETAQWPEDDAGGSPGR